MDPELQKEEFSNAFIIALSAAAGFSATKPRVDDDEEPFERHDFG